MYLPSKSVVGSIYLPFIGTDLRGKSLFEYGKHKMNGKYRFFRVLNIFFVRVFQGGGALLPIYGYKILKIKE